MALFTTIIVCLAYETRREQHEYITLYKKRTVIYEDNHATGLDNQVIDWSG